MARCRSCRVVYVEVLLLHSDPTPMTSSATEDKLRRLRVHCLTHASFEGPGAIEEWAIQRGHEFRVFRLFETEALPRIGHFDLLVVMGGPMSVHDETEYHWLRDEKKLLVQCLQQGVFVLEICLGSRLLAECLGSSVRRHSHREIGWFPVWITAGADSVMHELPGELTVFHWHGETYDLPPGTVLRVTSEGCPVQAFEHPTALGLQFHLEVRRSGVDLLLAHCGHELGNGPFEQKPSMILRLERTHSQAVNSSLNGLLDRIWSRIAANRKSE